MTLIVHCVPFGNDEPVHVAGPDCWCQPLIVEESKESDLVDECDAPVMGEGMFDRPDNITWTHHAKDCRERFERQGLLLPGNGWIIVAQTKEPPGDAFG